MRREHKGRNSEGKTSFTGNNKKNAKTNLPKNEMQPISSTLTCACNCTGDNCGICDIVQYNYENGTFSEEEASTNCTLGSGLNNCEWNCKVSPIGEVLEILPEWLVGRDISEFKPAPFKSTDEVEPRALGSILSYYYGPEEVEEIKDPKHKWTCCDFTVRDCVKCPDCWFDELGTGCHSHSGIGDCKETTCKNNGRKFISKRSLDYYIENFEGEK
tara:strand:+ start:40 stop:684 length:645 start_codon:yes stop_codon:yes gene_type:complete